MVVTNTRDPGKPEMTSMDKFIGTEFRSRYVNPTWIEGMKKEGYAGAGAMREFVEYLWGWNATVPELVDDAMWKETFDVYVEDKHKLGMKEFFEKKLAVRLSGHDGAHGRDGSQGLLERRRRDRRRSCSPSTSRASTSTARAAPEFTTRATRG